MKAFGLVQIVGLLKRQNLEVYKAVHPSPNTRPALRFTLRGARERARGRNSRATVHQAHDATPSRRSAPSRPPPPPPPLHKISTTSTSLPIAPTSSSAAAGRASTLPTAARCASSDPSSICLFEASNASAGAHSVPAGALGHGFTLDVGAYRFSPDMHLPGDLILHDLKLPTACYEPSCPPAQSDFPPPFLFNYSAPLRRIVDDKTQLPAGYATAIQTMLDKLDSLKAKVFVNAALIDFVPSTTTTSLTFHSGGAPPGSSNADMKVVAKGVVMLQLAAQQTAHDERLAREGKTLTPHAQDARVRVIRRAGQALPQHINRPRDRPNKGLHLL